MTETMNPLNFDVAVVGAGPGGASAALHLAMAGFSVGVFEKAKMPRYKTCGGGLLYRTLKLLPNDFEFSVERACFHAELHHHGPRLTYSTFRDKPIVSMVMRDSFDFQLMNLAVGKGAFFFPSTAVRNVKIESGQVRLSTDRGDYTSQFLVAADGVSSFIARQLGFPALRDVVPALECEAEVDAKQIQSNEHAARFDFGFVPQGYGWVFPKKNHLSIGVLTVARGFCNLNEQYERYRAALGLGTPLHEEKHGYMIPLRPRDRLFEMERVFLVGDAAGLADPITAEGISAAILSGQLAAQAIIRGKTVPKTAMKEYKNSLRREILIDLTIARGLAKILFRADKIRGWALRRHGKKLSEFMTDIVMGTATYRQLVRTPRHYLKLFSRK